MTSPDHTSKPCSRIALALAVTLCLAVFALPATAVAKEKTSVPARSVLAKAGGDKAGGKQVLGGLPFTGLDVVALAAVAVALTSMGFAVRRMLAEGESIS